MVLPFEHIEFSRKTLGRKYFSFQNILTNKTENLFICHKPNTINQSQDRENLEKRKIFSWLNNFLLAVAGWQERKQFVEVRRSPESREVWRIKIPQTLWLPLTLLSGYWEYSLTALLNRKNIWICCSSGIPSTRASGLMIISIGPAFV